LFAGDAQRDERNEARGPHGSTHQSLRSFPSQDPGDFVLLCCTGNQRWWRKTIRRMAHFLQLLGRRTDTVTTEPWVRRVTSCGAFIDQEAADCLVSPAGVTAVE